MSGCELKKQKNFLQSERGSSLVEFAVILPVLCLLVLGIGRFGITFNNHIALTDAVRSGARQLATGRGVTNPCQNAQNRVYAAAPTLSQASLPVTIIVNGSTISGNTCSNSILSTGQDVTVSATYPCSLTFFGINFAGGACQLSASTTARIE
jgi:Flp pilus assembly protein TadG